MEALTSRLAALPARHFWTAIITFTILSRLTAVLFLGDFQQPQLYEYGSIARHMIKGYGYSMLFPMFYSDYGIEQAETFPDAPPTAFTLPGYVFVMYAVLGTMGDSSAAYATLYLLNILMAALGVYLLFLLVREIHNTAAACWAALLAAVYPPFIAVATTFGGTPLYHVFMCLALLLVYRSASGSRTLRSALLAGVALALWISFRGEALGIGVLLSIWLWRKVSLPHAAVFLFTAVLLISPWMVRNIVVFDRFVPMTTNGSLNLWRGNNQESTGGAYRTTGRPNWLNDNIMRELRAVPKWPESPESDSEKAGNRLPAKHERLSETTGDLFSPDYEVRLMDVYKRHAWTFIREHPDQAALLYLKKLGMFFSFDFSDPRVYHPLFMISQAMLLLLAMAGAWRLLRHRNRSSWPLFAVVVFYALIVAALHVETRYQLIVSVIYIFFASAGLLNHKPGGHPGRSSSSIHS